MCIENEDSTAASIGPVSASRSDRQSREERRPPRTRGATSTHPPYALIRGRSTRGRPPQRPPRSGQPTGSRASPSAVDDVIEHPGAVLVGRPAGTISNRVQAPSTLATSTDPPCPCDDRLHDRQAQAEPAGVSAPAGIGPSEPIEDPIEVGGGDPRARVADRRSPPRRLAAERRASIVSVSAVCCTAFSITASSATASRSASASTTTSSVEPRTHCRGVAVHRCTASRHEPLDADRHRVRQLEVHRARKQEEPIDESAQTHQLVGDHRGVLRDRRIVRLALDQLRVAERHRDRRAELVGGVLDESTLTLEEPHVVHRHALRFLRGSHSTPRVPHHRREHGGHQRHLGELVEAAVLPASRRW